jgi:protocatechuate 3,4-dioxygenase beta subunit
MKLGLFFRTFLLLYLLFLPQIHAQSQRQASDNRARTASISGRLTIDGKPAVNSTVALKEVNREEGDRKTGAPGGAAGQRIYARVKTDDNGRYRFMRLAEGHYSIHAVSGAYVSKENCRYGNSCREVTLDDGEALENVDFTFVRGGVITGRVTDAEDRPVIAAGMLLLQVNEKGEPNSNFHLEIDHWMETETDDRGVYRLYGLPAGRYIIGVGGEQLHLRANPRLPATFHPDVSDRKQARVIEVKEDGVVESIDIRIGESRKTYEASGRVVDADSGQAIPNTRLHCLGFNDNDRPPKDVPVITNDQGQFKITELISGRYALYLQDEDVSGPYYSEGTRFVVNDRDVSGLEVKAYRGSTVSGIVIAAGVTDPAIKSKLQGAMLFVSFLGDRDPATANPGNLPGSSSKISADGRFRFNGAPPGKLMFLDHLGSVNDGLERIPFTFNRIERDGALVNQVIEIRRGEQVENLRIIVNYANGSIRGQVKIVGGNLPQGWRLHVYASRTGASEKSGGSQSRGAFVRVDESGRFLIEGLAPGEVEFEVTAVVQNNPDGGERPSGAEAVRQRVTVNNDVVTSVTINFDPSRRRQ